MDRRQKRRPILDQLYRAPVLEIALLTTPVPVISSFTPSSGPVGVEVTLTGSNFAGISSVVFNGFSAGSFAVDSATQCRATVPVGASSGIISMTNTDGTGESATPFTVILPPTVSGFSPSSGAIGSEVTITGAHFLRATAVSFGGVPTSTFSADSEITILVQVPSGAQSGKIRVTTAGGGCEKRHGLYHGNLSEVR